MLLAKPGALAGSEALDQARRRGTITAAHEAFWSAARRGEGEGTRALVHVLLLHRHLQHSDVVAGIRAALAVGSCAADLVALEACQLLRHTAAHRLSTRKPSRPTSRTLRARRSRACPRTGRCGFPPTSVPCPLSNAGTSC